MRRFIHIVVAAFLAAMCVIPAAGQNYKSSKVREKSEPEPLEFRKVFLMPGHKEKEQRELINKWDFNDYNLKYTGGPAYCDGMVWFLSAHDIDFKKVKGTVMGNFSILFNNGYITLEFNRIAIDWKGHLILDMSNGDDKFNRPWLWRVNHNPEVVQAARERCKEIFDTLCASLDNYLKEGPPWELQLVD